MGSAYREKIEKDSDLPEKRAVRDFIMSHFTDCKTIIGLAGPKIKEYIDWCETKNFTNIEIYENDKDTLMTQLYSLKKKPVKLAYGNINSVNPDLKHTFYDFDYCSTVLKFKDEIDKFHNNYCFTFSRRLVGTEGTIDKFFEIMNEKVLNVSHNEYPINHRKYVTQSGGQYIYAPYFDTSPMCCIAKIN